MRKLENHILFTKDGRKTGNALVVDIEGEQYIAKTDYGNVIRITEREMNELFYVGDKTDNTHKYYSPAAGEVVLRSTSIQGLFHNTNTGDFTPVGRKGEPYGYHCLFVGGRSVRKCGFSMYWYSWGVHVFDIRDLRERAGLKRTWAMDNKACNVYDIAGQIAKVWQKVHDFEEFMKPILYIQSFDNTGECLKKLIE